MYSAYVLTVANLSNFSSPIAFTCTVHQNFPPPNISRVLYHKHVYINSYVMQFNLDQPSDNIDIVLRQVAKRIGALMKGNVIIMN